MRSFWTFLDVLAETISAGPVSLRESLHRGIKLGWEGMVECPLNPGFDDLQFSRTPHCPWIFGENVGICDRSIAFSLSAISLSCPSFSSKRFTYLSVQLVILSFSPLLTFVLYCRNPVNDLSLSLFFILSLSLSPSHSLMYARAHIHARRNAKTHKRTCSS